AHRVDADRRHRDDGGARTRPHADHDRGPAARAARRARGGPRRRADVPRGRDGRDDGPPRCGPADGAVNAPSLRPGRTKTLLLALAVCAAVPYLAILGWLKWHETDLIYRPQRVMHDVPGDLGLVPERLRITDAAGAA